MQQGQTMRASSSFKERGLIILREMIDAEPGTMWEMIPGSARIDGGEEFAMVYVSVGDIKQPFKTEELRELCGFLEDKIVKSDDVPLSPFLEDVVSTFVLMGREAADHAEQEFAKEQGIVSHERH